MFFAYPDWPHGEGVSPELREIISPPSLALLRVFFAALLKGAIYFCLFFVVTVQWNLLVATCTHLKCQDLMLLSKFDRSRLSHASIQGKGCWYVGKQYGFYLKMSFFFILIYGHPNSLMTNLQLCRKIPAFLSLRVKLKRLWSKQSDATDFSSQTWSADLKDKSKGGEFHVGVTDEQADSSSAWVEIKLMCRAFPSLWSFFRFKMCSWDERMTVYVWSEAFSSPKLIIT